MAFIEWNYSQFGVGVGEIDEQHMKLIELINLLHAKMKEGQGKEVILKVLDELNKYTKYHFSTEEYMMVHHSYVNYGNHKTEHDKFIKDLEELRKKYDAGSRSITMDTFDFLKNWLLHHIKESDVLFGKFMKSRDQG